MTSKERLKQINEHFKNVTVKEFEKNLIKTGIMEIEHSGGEIVHSINRHKEVVNDM